MINKDYLRFFNECLNHNMTIKKYVPVQDKIFKIIDFCSTKVDLKSTQDYKKVKFAKAILKTFSKILDKNRYENLDEYIDFLIYIGIYQSYFADMLNVMVFKDESPNSNRADYYLWYMLTIFSFAENKKDILEDFYGQSRIVSMIKMYYRYFEDPYLYTLPMDIASKRRDYEGIALGVIADIYDTDLDLSILDSFLNDLVNDYERVMTYLGLNGLLRNYEKTYGIEYAYETLKQFDKQKRIIR